VLARTEGADVQEFADFFSELLASATQARILAAIKSLFAFGHQVGYLPFDVGRPVSRLILPCE
jgi:integrase/recombinase XerD